MNLYGPDEKDHQEAQQDEAGGMAAIAYPLLAIAATVCCWCIAVLLAGAMQ